MKSQSYLGSETIEDVAENHHLRSNLCVSNSPTGPASWLWFFKPQSVYAISIKHDEDVPISIPIPFIVYNRGGDSTLTKQDYAVS